MNLHRLFSLPVFVCINHVIVTLDNDLVNFDTKLNVTSLADPLNLGIDILHPIIGCV